MSQPGNLPPANIELEQPLPTDDTALRAIVEGVETETGERFFHSLVQHLATAFNVQYAFVSEFSDDRQRFRTRAVWGRGQFLPNFEIPIVGTPCEAVLNGQIAHHPTQLRVLFPSDHGLVLWEAESYCGVPLLDTAGTCVGHLAIMDDKPMLDGPRGSSILRIFAARALAEIERLRIEQALRESEERFRDLYNEAPVAYLSVGTDTRIRRANRQAAEMFGCPLDQLFGRVMFDFLADTPSGKSKARAVFERFLAGLETLNEEIEWRRADGTTFWTRSSVRPIFDAQGRVEATRSMHVDITDRKRMEESLRLSEERLASVLFSATDGIVTFNETRQVEIFNRAAETIFGCSAVQAIGRPIDRFLTDGLHRTLARSLKTFRQNDQATSYLWAPEGLLAKRADGGSLFLDEIGEMPPEAQVKLLRVLQEQEFERVGGNKTIRVDVRLITATNRDLTKAVAEGKFRQDLYYRLNVFPVSLPPLRERPEDIPLLVHYFVARYAAKIGRQLARVPKETLQRLTTYPWPGNIRELENVIERAVILSPGPELKVAVEALPPLPALVSSSVAIGDAPSDSSSIPLSLEEAERTHIISVLKKTDWRIDGPQGAARHEAAASSFRVNRNTRSAGCSADKGVPAWM